MYCDNDGAVKLVYQFHQRTKHIGQKWHWIREQVQGGYLDIKFVRTEDQLADIFTKAFSGPKFVSMRDRIGVGLVADLPGIRLRKRVGSQSHPLRQLTKDVAVKQQGRRLFSSRRRDLLYCRLLSLYLFLFYLSFK